MTLNEEQTPATNNVIDINIGGATKSKFRINGDDNAILELNLSDLNIADRLEKGYKNIHELLLDMSKLDTDNDNLSEELHKADKKMREQLDYIFDSNVSEVCCKSGTMYDVVDGKYRFEHIADSLTKLYSNNLNKEYQNLKSRIQKHTEQYVNKPNKSRKGK